MVTNYTENNYLVLIGKVISDKKFSHEIYGESFYVFNLEVPRLSGNEDIIPITISERLLANFDLVEGKKVVIEGQFRSYNSYENGDNKLILTVFAKDICSCEDELPKNLNSLFLNGYVCKEPVYRTTPFGREITDLLLAVNRTYNKSDYIPVIAWGRNARYCKGFKVGDNVRVWGRIQSRDYQKRLSEDEVITKTAYEVSVSKLELVDKDETL